MMCTEEIRYDHHSFNNLLSNCKINKADKKIFDALTGFKLMASALECSTITELHY